MNNGEDMENALKMNPYGKTLSFCELFFIRKVRGDQEHASFYSEFEFVHAPNDILVQQKVCV